MFIFIDWFDRQTFKSLLEAEAYLQTKEKTERDCCYIENIKTKEIWISDISGNLKKKTERFLTLC